MNLNELNPEQRRAAETLEGPVLILAGAGSGKTRALTYRLANLIDHGVRAWQILALTFTNKAAKEMKTRVESLIGTDQAEEAWISTFHSICARILRRDIEKIGYSRSFAIYDDDDQRSLIRNILKELNIDDKYLPEREVRSKISDAKNRMLTPDEWFMKSTRDRRNSLIHDVMTVYEKKLKSMNALDFDDLLLKTLILFSEHPPVLEYYRNRFRYVMVDEYQDTNRAQYELIRILTAESRNLCVVGDDDQSIYGWRGADLHNILDFEKDFPDVTVIKLEQNYRSTSNILDAANQVIANNEQRKDKKLWTQAGTGEKIHVFCACDEREESFWIASKIMKLHQTGVRYGEIAVLYRTNAQSRVPEEMLMKAGIPYKVFGGQKFYDRKEIRDVLAYLRVIANPSDDISLRRIINVPKRSIGDTTVQTIAEHAAGKGYPFYSAMFDLPEKLPGRARKNVTEFLEMMTELSALKDSMGLSDFVDFLIEKTGLIRQYEQDETEEAQSRIENIREFQGAVHEFEDNSDTSTLEAYLENVALVTDFDREDDLKGYATLMTLHSAKGLEFEYVFIPGLEEGIFPGSRSLTEDFRLEEERRLIYVGITRAKKGLYLSRCSERMLYNQFNRNPPSRFLDEIPVRLTEEEYSSRQRTATPAYRPEYPAKPYMTRTESHGPAFSAKPSGKAGLTFKGMPIDRIPGVSRGFQPSKARETTVPVLFHPGDTVYHRKFGRGQVLDLSGTGADARIRILFEEGGEKELALLIAPIVKVED